MNRRQLLSSLGRSIGLAMLSVPAVRALAACTSVHETAVDARVDGAGATADAASTPDSSAATDWASGGTAAMTDKASYPDPFASVALTTCALVCDTTAGPCTSTTEERQDVSEGLGGLPVRLALKIVDDTCAPVTGAVVEIWHTQKSGVYSGVTPNPQMCEGTDTDAPNHLYFRGTQTTDANGRVDFDTCFPGWYTSRAIHIHVQVFIGGTEYVTTQLFFADALVQSICASHPDYDARGQPDTTDATDNVIGGVADQSPYVLTVARMTDGAMMASKVLTIRAATTESVCSVG